MPAVEIARRWLASYTPRERELARRGPPTGGDALSEFREAVRAAPGQAAIHYFDVTLTYRELDRLSDAFAAHLASLRIPAGERVALYMQNIPQYAVCLVGAWKAGLVGVSINPMSRARELRLLLADCGARVLVLQRDLFEPAVSEVLPEFPGLVVISTSARDFQSRSDPRVFTADEPPVPPQTRDLCDLLLGHEGHVPAARRPQPRDAAMIVYTSGTTGVPKGAVVTHGGLAFEARVWRDWCDVREGGPILAVAPLFHITGLVGHLVLAFAAKAPMILAMRFHPDVVADAAREHRAEFVVAAITAFIAMMNSPAVTREHLQTLRRVYSGGAPVPAAVAAQFEAQFGHRVHNGYGLTESTSVAIAVPPAVAAPIDESGALSIGLPVFGTDAYIAGDQGQPLPAGQVGEVMLRGPHIVDGYWGKPDESAAAITPDGFLRTGDVGYMDANGWVFLVDRKKDMIIASGYKVWPKEVEDVLYTHPAVREAAVVGVPDSYRGETVKAVLALKEGSAPDADALIAYCRERMAAYKVPRVIEFLPELPKTLTGKILRRELR